MFPRPDRLLVAGAAAMLVASPALAQPSVTGRCRQVYQQAIAARQAADGAVAHADYRRANRLLDDGLAALGSAYQRADMIDDTGLHLVLATSIARKGQLRRAATLKRRVLVERLALCAAR